MTYFFLITFFQITFTNVYYVLLFIISDLINAGEHNSVSSVYVWGSFHVNRNIVNYVTVGAALFVEIDQ